MKYSGLFLLIILILGCNTGMMNYTDSDVKALESKVVILQKKVHDQNIKIDSLNESIDVLYGRTDTLAYLLNSIAQHVLSQSGDVKLAFELIEANTGEDINIIHSMDQLENRVKSIEKILLK